MKVNPYLAALPGGYLFAEVANRVKSCPHKDVIRMGIGDVTLPISKAVADAFSKAALEMATPEGFRGYAPDFGYDFLIDAIIQNDYEARGVTLSRGEVFISDGAKTDTGAVGELFSPDARVAVTDPVYPVYVDANAMAGRAGAYRDGRWERICYLPCNEENGFVPPVPDGRVDVLYLCYPNNPTGTVLTKAQLKRFVDYARENGALIVYDAAYKAFITRDDIPRSIYEIEGAKDVAIECCSFSKTAGFTGVRCAYMVIPESLRGEGGESLNALWRRRTGAKSNGVSYPVQRAAEAVFTGEGKRQTGENIAFYLENARIIREGLQKAGLSVYGGENAPYIWLKTPGMGSWAFFDFLLNTARVVGTPGAGFGPCGEGYFRLTAFGGRENTIEAVDRITHALRRA